MTKQEIFDKVVAHLRQQGVKCASTEQGEELCAYRGADGTKCAIGALIPDELYDPKVEGASVGALLNVGLPDLRTPESVRIADFLSRLTKWDHDTQCAIFLDGLQRIHDGWPPIDWEREFGNFAKVWNLNFTPNGA